MTIAQIPNYPSRGIKPGMCEPESGCIQNLRHCDTFRCSVHNERLVIRNLGVHAAGSILMESINSIAVLPKQPVNYARQGSVNSRLSPLT